MRFPRKRGATSVMVRVFIPDNSVTTGAGCTGLSSSSTNLTIAYLRELDSAATTYTGSNIETITTIGTYQAPSSSSKARFKAVDATNAPGLYEIHFHNSATAFGTGDASNNVIINVYEATTTALKIGPNMVLIPLSTMNVLDGESNSIQLSGTSLTGRDIGASVLLSSGTGTGQLDFTSGVVKSNLAQILGTALTETAGQIAAAFKKFFDKADPTGTINSIPDAVAGASGGIAIVGSVMGKSPATLAAADVTGNLPADIKAYTVQPTVTGATLAADQAVNTTKIGGTTQTAGDFLGVWTPTKAGYLTGAVALEATLTAIKGAGWTTETLAAIDVLIDAIKAKTDNLPSDPADESALEAAITAATSPLATSAELAKVPKSDGTASWNATALAAINAEVDTALNTAIPGSPTSDSINERVKAIDDLTQASGAGDLAAILTDTGTTLDTKLNTIDDFIDTEVAAIKAKTDNLPASPAAVGSQMDLVNAPNSTATTAIANAVLDQANGIETSLTLREAIRIALAVLAGKLSGAASTTVTIRNVGDTKNRVTATVDASGNRSTVTVDGT